MLLDQDKAEEYHGRIETGIEKEIEKQRGAIGFPSYFIAR